MLTLSQGLLSTAPLQLYVDFSALIPTQSEILLETHVIPMHIDSCATMPEICPELDENPPISTHECTINSRDMVSIIKQIGDVIRGTLIVDDMRTIPTLIKSIRDKIKKHKGEIYIKNFWKEPQKFGYVGIHLKMGMCIPTQSLESLKPDRFILMELQIHPRELMDGTPTCIKELSHSLYKGYDRLEESARKTVLAASQLLYLVPMIEKLLYQNSEEEKSKAKHTSIYATLKKILPSTYTGDEKSKCIDKILAIASFCDHIDGADPAVVIANTLSAIAKKVNVKSLSTLPLQDTAKPSMENSAKSEQELLDHAEEAASFFKELCEDEASQNNCEVTFGPDNTCIKSKKSLHEKCEKDVQEMQKKKQIEAVEKLMSIKPPPPSPRFDSPPLGTGNVIHGRLYEGNSRSNADVVVAADAPLLRPTINLSRCSSQIPKIIKIAAICISCLTAGNTAYLGVSYLNKKINRLEDTQSIKPKVNLLDTYEWSPISPCETKYTQVPASTWGYCQFYEMDYSKRDAKKKLDKQNNEREYNSFMDNVYATTGTVTGTVALHYYT
jgi:hypothetical protein